MQNEEKKATVIVNQAAVLICFTSILYIIINYFIAQKLFVVVLQMSCCFSIG